MIQGDNEPLFNFKSSLLPHIDRVLARRINFSGNEKASLGVFRYQDSQHPFLSADSGNRASETSVS